MTSRLLAITVSVLFFVAFPATARAQESAQTGQLQVTATLVCTIAPIDLKADGFLPASAVVEKVDASQVDILKADTNGEISFTVRFETAGTHTVSVSGQANSPRGAARTLSVKELTAEDCTSALGNTNVLGIKSGKTTTGSEGNGSGTAGNQASGLPHTGASVSTPMMAAAGLILTGALLVIVGTRRRRQHR